MKLLRTNVSPAFHRKLDTNAPDIVCAVGIRSDELQYSVQNIRDIHWRSRMSPVVIIVTVVGEDGNSCKWLMFGRA